MKHFLISLILIFTVLFLTSCITPHPEKKCFHDSDCVPAVCCHPADTVNKENAPLCEKIMCSQECVPHTLDCGQGEIKCIKNECKIILK
jgi:hypothetical protein